MVPTEDLYEKIFETDKYEDHPASSLFEQLGYES